MSRIRVLMLADCLRRGGSERQLASFLSHLFPSDEISVVLLTRNVLMDYELPVSPDLRTIVPEKPLTKREYFRAIKGTIFEFKPHIIHSWEKTGATSAAIYKLFHRGPLKLIDGTSRFARKLSPASSVFWNFQFNHLVSDVVIANSKAALAVHGHSAVRNEKYLIIPNGIDLGRFPDLNDRAVPPELVMTASFTPAKDHSTVILGMIELLRRGVSVRLNFVGDGPGMESAIASVPPQYEQGFRFLGKRNDVDEIVGNGGIGVLLNSPGHAEGMSNAVMEYMAAGLPVICTDAGGNRDLVVNGENGFLVPYSSPAEFAAAVEKMLASPENMSRMGQISRDRIGDYSMERMTERYLAIYRKMAT